MQLVDIFMLVVGIVWVLFTLCGVAMFLPPLTRRLREWEVRLKPASKDSRMPTYPQRTVFLLLTLLMTAVSMSRLSMATSAPPSASVLGRRGG